MDRKLLKHFFKDQFVNSIAYFSGCFLIGLFFYLDSKKKIEIVYPLMIVLFIYLIWMLISLIEYHKIYHGLEEMLQYHDYPGEFHQALHRRMKHVVRKLHKEYLMQLSQAESDRKKERRFISLWIHNMKTPVTVTDLMLQRMEQGELEPIAGIEPLKEENRKLLSGLDTVLNMIRLEDFAKDYIPEPMNLLEEIKLIINKNKSLFIYNRVFPKIMTELEHTVILSDRKWNELMIHQLISNAVKYSRDEEGNAKNIYFILEKDNEQQISLTIRDEGIGIPEHDIGKVCDPFFTGDNGRKGYQSSGIGLYFCSEVCKLLGHTLKISSEVGQGTAVTISYLTKL